jgi:hypothetical protein
VRSTQHRAAVRRRIRTLVAVTSAGALAAAVAGAALEATVALALGAIGLIVAAVTLALRDRDEGPGGAADAGPVAQAVAGAAPRRDVFISHASEDKATIARPLAKQLRSRGCSVWFDEYELVLGDSLRSTIGDGLRHSLVGVVILSHSFFAKRWPQWELDGLTARHIAGERNVILPVWHEVGSGDVRSYSPPLADLVAAKSSDGVEAVADAVLRVLRTRAAADEPGAALPGADVALPAGTGAAAAGPALAGAAGGGSLDSRRHRLRTSPVIRTAVLATAVGVLPAVALLLATDPFGSAGGEPRATSSTPRASTPAPAARARTG